MRKTIFLLAGSMALSLGCVSQGAYDNLKQKYDTASGKVAVAETSIKTLEESLDAAQRKAAKLEQDAAALNAAIKALEAARATDRARQAELDAQLGKQSEELAGVIKDRGRLRETALELQEALADLARRKAEADRRVAEARNLLARFKPLIDAGTLRVSLIEGRMVLALPTDVLFDTGSAQLSKAGKLALAEVALVLHEDFADRRFQVEGHTDNVPIHNTTYASNWELAAARALGVVKLMVDRGVAPSALSAASHGENRPAMPNESDAGRAYNRRIEIILVPDLSSLPGAAELKTAVERS